MANVEILPKDLNVNVLVVSVVPIVNFKLMIVDQIHVLILENVVHLVIK